MRVRLTELDTEKDQWWPIISASVTQVSELVRDRGLPIFVSYQLDGPIAALDGSDIENGNLGLLSSLTMDRACLLLSRMHEHLGNREKCIETATVGLRLCPPMASGLKSAFKEILRRHGRSV